MASKKFLKAVSALLLWAAICPTFAFGQFAVIDVANLNQNIAQYEQQVRSVAQEYQQLQQLIQQLQQAKQQYASITGVRGLGEILIEDYTQISPATVNSAMNVLGASGQSSTYAKQFQQQSSLTGQSYFADVPQTVIDDLNAALNGQASQKGMNASAYQSAVDRYSRLEQIRQQIQCTQDIKAITELQARLQAESTEAQNELIKIQSMNAMLQSDQELQRHNYVQRQYQTAATPYQRDGT